MIWTEISKIKNVLIYIKVNHCLPVPHQIGRNLKTLVRFSIWPAVDMWWCNRATSGPDSYVLFVCCNAKSFPF